MSITLNVSDQLKTVDAIALNNGSLRTVHSVWYNNNGTLERIYPEPIICTGSGLGLMTNRGTYIANSRTSAYQPQSTPAPSTSSTQVLMTTNNTQADGIVDYGGAAYSTAIPIDLTDFSTITVNATLRVTGGGNSRGQIMSVSLSTTKPTIASNSTYGFPAWGTTVLSFNASISASISPAYGNNNVAQTKSASLSSYSGSYYIVVNSYLGGTEGTGSGTSLVNSITLS